MVTAATIYMSLLGPQGLARVAAASMSNTESLAQVLGQVPGLEVLFAGPRFHELALRLDRLAAPVLQALAEKGIAGGFDLSADYPELGNAMLVCATETKTQGDILEFRDALLEVMGAEARRTEQV
jgi:glycine dehydrogenase subunit 1